MKLSKALTKLKDLKSKVSQAQRYVEQSVTHYIDEEPEYDYLEERIKYYALEGQITSLKTVIQITNATTNVEYKGAEMTLTQLILTNATLRSDLSFCRGLLNTSLSRSRSILSDEGVKQKYATAYDKMELRGIIEDLESDKLEMEATLASVNLRTELVEL